jgi:hypothetical protein
MHFPPFFLYLPVSLVVPCLLDDNSSKTPSRLKITLLKM